MEGKQKHTETLPDRVIRTAELCKMLGMSRPTVYRLLKSGDLPAGLHIGPKARGWRLSTIMRWLDAKEEQAMELQG